MLARIKELEHQGYEFEAADGSLALLIRRALANTPPPFTVDAYHVSMRAEATSSVCEATVKVRVGNESRAHAWPTATVRSTRSTPRCAPRSSRFYPQLRDGPADRLQGPHHRFDERHRRARTRVLIESSDGSSRVGHRSASTRTSSKPACRRWWTASSALLVHRSVHG